jgi:Uma2 family endonuclease
MTIASGRSQTNPTTKRMTLEEYLTYDDGTDARYELVDGVLVAMGAENPLNPLITAFLMFLFADLGIPRKNLVIGHQVGVSSSMATARQPDLIIHTNESRAAILDDGKILRAGRSAPMLVVEVVSNSAKDKRSRDRDYEEKPSEYAQRGIPEYWIIDPDRAVVKIGTLNNGEYQFQDFAGDDALVSPSFPPLASTPGQVLTAGRSF